MMDKKTVLAFVMIGLVIILMPYYYQLFMPQPPKEKIQALADSLNQITEEAVKDTPTFTTEKAVVDAAALGAPIQVWQDTTNAAEEFALVETPYYMAKFSSKGGRIVSFRLKEYSDRRGGITEMILAPAKADRFYPNAYLTFQKSNISTDNLNFSFDNSGIRLDKGASGQLTLTAALNNGGNIKYFYKFNADSYKIELKTVSQGVQLDDEYYFRWDGGVNVTELDTVQDLTYCKAYAYMGGEVEEFDAKGASERRINPSGKVDWIAVRSKYFEIAAIPNGNTLGADFVGKKVNAGTHPGKEFKLAVKMENPSGDLNQNYTLYLGPIDSQKLSALKVGLEATMNWGWVIIKPFSIFILWSFKMLRHVIPNYGIVIIIFSILIKVVLWPLTQKSYVSMKQMQKLQPFLKEIKEKYKGDAQRMQKETAKLYKEHKVNPFGGCLPMLLQMPLLYALFIVFRSTIELRGAPFVFWIDDLSLPDTIYQLGFTIPMYGDQVALLPILMGVTTYFQSKISMTDPSQKMMLYFMPIFLTLLFNNFPSGLNLYYALFNVLSMVQQKMVHSKE